MHTLRRHDFPVPRISGTSSSAFALDGEKGGWVKPPNRGRMLGNLADGCMHNGGGLGGRWDGECLGRR